MRLSAKHANENRILYGDFTGGLNTATIPEMIGDKQLAKCVNMELNRSNGALQTCCGNVMIYKALSGVQLDSVYYDKINNTFLMFDMTTGKVYKSQLIDMRGTDVYDCVLLGELTGKLKPIVVMWEYGLLIASGGRLQYWNGVELLTLEKSPAVCNGVFTKSGRVWVWYEYRLHCSAVGDEETWEDSSLDDSSSKWLDVGYKEGENDNAYILGVSALSSDIIIIKANGRVYRLTGDYPNWTLLEVTRNVICLNRDSYCAVQDGLFILGRNSLFYLQTTANYGDVFPENVAVNVADILYELSSDNTYMKYIPALNQIWIVGSGTKTVVFDLNFKTFFQRDFAHRVQDICMYNHNTLLVRKDKVTQIASGTYNDETFSDDEAPIKWEFRAKTLSSYHNYLLKRMKVNYVPLSDSFDMATINTAKGRAKAQLQEAQKYRLIVTDNSLIINDNESIFPTEMQYKTKVMCYRNVSVDMYGEGYNAPIMLQQIQTTMVEVGGA